MTHQQPSPETAEACAKFVKWALTEGSWRGADIDGGAAQELAESLGLITETKYDPEKHGDGDGCAEPGDTWYELSAGLLSLLPQGNASE